MYIKENSISPCRAGPLACVHIDSPAVKWRIQDIAAVSNSITIKDLSIHPCIHCRENVNLTDLLQCYECKSWVPYECTELPTYTLVSLKISQI